MPKIMKIEDLYGKTLDEIRDGVLPLRYQIKRGGPHMMELQYNQCLFGNYHKTISLHVV